MTIIITIEQNNHDFRLAIEVAYGYIEGITLPSNSEGGDQYYRSSSSPEFFPLAEIAKPIDSRSSQDD